MIIETSKDILYIVIAFCVLWLSIFLSWLLYYFICIVRRMSNFIESFSRTLEKVEEAAKVVKEKVEHSASYFVVAAEAFKEVVKYVIEKRQEFREKREEPVKRKKKEESI